MGDTECPAVHRGFRWIAFSRTEYITMGPRGWGSSCPTAAWPSRIERTPVRGPGVVISYDHGWSFQYALTGPYETVHAFAHGEDEFIVFTGKSHRSDMSAGVYRWILRR